MNDCTRCGNPIDPSVEVADGAGPAHAICTVARPLPPDPRPCACRQCRVYGWPIGQWADAGACPYAAREAAAALAQANTGIA